MSVKLASVNLAGSSCRLVAKVRSVVLFGHAYAAISTGGVVLQLVLIHYVLCPALNAGGKICKRSLAASPFMAEYEYSH